jgi:hypothetical protein
MRKKKVDPETGTEVEEHDDPLAGYNAAIDAVACGVKRLCDAGIGAGAAGDLALKIYNQSNGIKE